MKPAFRAVLLAAAVVLLAFGLMHRPSGSDAPLAVGAAAPSERLPTLDGGEAPIVPPGARLTVVNFWATWCAPCVAEMPSLERLHRALPGQGLVVIGISVDESEADVREFVARAGLHFPVLRDPGGRGAARVFGVEGYPTTFVIDAAGVVRERYLGPARWDEPEALDHFRGLLSASTSPTR
jgi:thiol-disulfide isomerase/thioredoxin